MLSKLDLQDYINNLKSFFAREKDFILQGDINVHFNFIKTLENINLNPLPKVSNLDTELMHLKKRGTLSHSQIFEFIKIIRYFLYLKSSNIEKLQKYLSKIEIPQDILKINNFYNKNGELQNIEELDNINQQISLNKDSIRQVLYKILNSKKLEPFLVDRQIHILNGEEALLVRGGFNRFLKADIVGRSSGGFFYVFPQEISKLKQKESELLSQKEEILFKFAKEFSSTFNKWLKFLEFINKEFDKLDHYKARIDFAKANNYNFILPEKSNKIILKGFCHPALKNCKSIDLEYDKNILIITGVNAGGKTMLLKSILSAAYMSKYLLPMHININSKIGHFKEIIPIIEDPQNVKNDISTFAGRMQQFSKLFGKKNILVGIDEIELGTDANEAAILFKNIIEELINQKIVITTHHKRLASLLANREEVELLAAIYDEKAQKPTYEFIKGTIGKSYAFETALKYNIPKKIIDKSKKEYGEDLENLSHLIEKSAKLELEMKIKLKKLNEELQEVERLKENLKHQKEEFNQKIEQEKDKLLKEYNEAIKLAKEAIKAKTTQQAHKKLNEANKVKNKIKIKKEEISEDLKIGDNVKYFNSKGIITNIKNNMAFVDIDGKELKVPISSLKKYSPPKQKPKIKINKPTAKKAAVRLDLHGKRYEEAMELVDEFINNALLANLNEVVITHGMGSGILAKGVKEFLKNHPSIKSFCDAPANMGGFGSTLVKL